MATKTDWAGRIWAALPCYCGDFSPSHGHATASSPCYWRKEIRALLHEFAKEAAEMADSHGDFVVGRKIRDMLPPKKEDDVCPRCKGSFEQTGGRPANPPYICQKCFMETEED